LQSYTILPYYHAFHTKCGGIDKYFTPFYRVDRAGKFSFEEQLVKSDSFPLVPQVLTNDAAELIDFAKSMLDRGFDEINLNIGCPFPMVANRHLGAGLLPYKDEVQEMLLGFYNEQLPIKLSVKCRLGWEDKMDIWGVMQVFQDFPIHELIVHPRLGVQKYKGTPDWQSFGEVVLLSPVDIAGNGDINSKEELHEKMDQFSSVKAWMLDAGTRPAYKSVYVIRGRTN